MGIWLTDVDVGKQQFHMIKGHLQERIHTSEVVAMAAIVPTGMDFWASAKSPERFDPAMIPVKWG